MATLPDTTAPPPRPRPRPRRGPSGYWWYVLPMAVGFAGIVLAPFVANVVTSLFSWLGGAAPMHFVGLGNYRDLFTDATFWRSFENSVYMVVAVVVVPTVIGLVIAAVLFDYLGRRFGDRVVSVLRATFYLPQILPIAVAGVLWSWILAQRDGAVNAVLRALGAHDTPDWLGDPHIAVYSVMLVLVWLQIGYPVLIFMAALQRIDPELHEAAEVDGAGWWRRFFAVTLPQIRPEVFVVVLTATVGALKVFAPVLILTQGGPQNSTYVPSYYSYLNFFEYSRVGYGAAIATVMSVLILVVATLLLAWQRRAARRDEA
ncbi:sugar ABC transporter permease [Streptomyces tremellae]|uniref:Sugar ABC transporter permease n=1 Tax=Streptomyces tremellae TaxID=1124239 RepID=A0ABP7FV05_9ACTN